MIMPWLYMHIYNLMRMMIMKLILKGEYNKYDDPFSYQCFMCEPGCVTCDGPSPCVLTLNWVLRSILLAVSILILCGIPLLVWFTFQYRDVKVTRDVCQHLQQPCLTETYINSVLLHLELRDFIFRPNFAGPKSC